MGPDALIFDVDGTLSETGELHRTSFNLAFRDLGIKWEWTPTLFARLPDTVSALERLTYYVAHFQGATETALMSSSILDHIAAVKDNYFAQMIENGAASLRPGVARLIREAGNAGIPLAIASLSAREDFEHLLLNHLGIEAMSLFSVVITREALPEEATRADAYQAAIASLGVPPARAFAIDASVDGVKAAKSRGLNVVATPGMYTGPGRLDAADYVLSDLGHPAAPFQVMRGDVGAHNFVSVEALRDWAKQLAQMAAA